MKTIHVYLLLFVAAGAALFQSCENDVNTAAALGAAVNAAPSHEEMVKRGEYLVNIMVCDDCHSPKALTAEGPVIIDSLRLSGFNPAVRLPKFDPKLTQEQHVGLFSADLTSIAGPWGTSFPGNLTPDELGIGNWTEEQFIKCIREGKLKGLDGSRPLLPPMPWQQYRLATDDDLKAIFAFLKSLRPVRNIVPQPLPPGVQS